MSLNDKVRLLPNGRELIRGEADVDIDDAVALRAGEMVVVVVSLTDTVVMCPVGKLDAGEQSSIHQLFDRTIDRGSSDAWLVLS
jgi:hypothetical protein